MLATNVSGIITTVITTSVVGSRKPRVAFVVGF